MPAFKPSFVSKALARSFVILGLLACASPCAAQSSDFGLPTPVLSTEVSGRIAPRDVGDPRRTRHFYTFRGTEGDLSVTFESTELLGAVDVYTATTQRPLLTITLFGDATRASKSFYLRKEETLVLRVEARAVGDAEGSYRIVFGGSFLPAPAELVSSAPTPTPAPTPTAERRGRNVRRVTSTGARIEEPAAEVAEEAAPTPTPTPERAAEPSTRTPAPRRGRAARQPSNRNRGAGGSRPAAESATTEGGEKKPDEPAAPAESGTATPAESSARPSTPARRRGSRNTRRNSGGSTATRTPTDSSAPSGAQPTPAPAPLPTQRLVIVTREGETLERDMSTVRRVTVENNQLVVVGKDGKVTRRPMASVLRMSIEP